MRNGPLKNTIITVFFSFMSLAVCTYSTIYPAWFQQKYKEHDPVVFQGFGIFNFYSTQPLQGPFYASETTLAYSEFCANEEKGLPPPNWMLGGDAQFKEILCGYPIKGIQYVSFFASVFAAFGLIASVAACFNPAAGYAERIVSSTTLISSLLLLAALIVWAIQIQQKMLEIDVISSAYVLCQKKTANWSCWFYGYSFWAAIGGVVGMLITMYTSSAGRAEKIRHFRQEYEADLAIAMQQSMEATAANVAPSGAFSNQESFGDNMHHGHQPYQQGYNQQFYNEPTIQNANHYAVKGGIV
ncbi:hypothetical protein H310_12656 [Aphanomyces invadans]|uniref:Uncharacterized protein n=1 Tax=Aphanomyces invadans TaxID=157072 RepID=A0A024THA3_9STRA|nr:hypothetical protein H310_12656 [Aphanomyces invadans]ETV93413.1 hypothetical protein H310_12656 [Aphanomyces invadans]|eukprot:XP_008878049.1 hypothetical protein H310_12656 [Aphanomyces invadans]